MGLIPTGDICQRPAVYVPLPLRHSMIDPQGHISGWLQDQFSKPVAEAGLVWDVKLWPQSLILWGDMELVRLAFFRLGHFAIFNSRKAGTVTLEFIRRGRMAECSMSFTDAAATKATEMPCDTCAVDLCRRQLQIGTRPDLCVARYVAEAHGGWLWSDRGARRWTRIAMTLPEHASLNWSS